MRPRSSNLPKANLPSVGLVLTREVLLEVAHQVLEDVHMLGPSRFAYGPSRSGLSRAWLHTRQSVPPNPACRRLRKGGPSRRDAPSERHQRQSVGCVELDQAALARTKANPKQTFPKRATYPLPKECRLDAGLGCSFT